jgi:osmoprotectant transport system permease protein
MLTNAYVGINEVDPDAVQAARAMGMRPSQVLWRVELPLATPLIMAGIRTGTVYVVATATLATFAGGGGLGDIIVNEPTYGTAGVIAGALTITVLAFVIDGLLALVELVVTPRPLRQRGRRARVEAVVEPSLDAGAHR